MEKSAKSQKTSLREALVARRKLLYLKLLNLPTSSEKSKAKEELERIDEEIHKKNPKKYTIESAV